MSSERRRIKVINPNSDASVTTAISEGCADLSFRDGPVIDYVTLAEGPPAIVTQLDYERVALPLRNLVAADKSSAVFVIACYSDPGIQVCREASSLPVLGIGECGLLTALLRGSSIGVLAIGEVAIPRHLRYLRQLGLLDRLAGERPLNLSVAETASGAGTFERLVHVGAQLREQDSANVVVLGCAGLSRHRTPLEARLGIPVVDPCRAAVSMAIGLAQSGK